jgi:hypothetical protein
MQAAAREMATLHGAIPEAEKHEGFGRLALKRIEFGHWGHRAAYYSEAKRKSLLPLDGRDARPALIRYLLLKSHFFNILRELPLMVLFPFGRLFGV